MAAPTKDQFTPKQIGGTISFTVGEKSVELVNTTLSFQGVFGLDWGSLNPEAHFGQKIIAKVDVHSKPALSFKTHALLISELTPGHNRMGIKFLKMDETVQKNFSETLEKQGSFPPFYSRKFPRLPARQFEELAKIRVSASSPDLTKAVLMEVDDMNPQGMMLESEDPLCASVQPGRDLTLKLDVSGTIGHFVIETIIKVRRVFVERSLTTGKRVYRMGTTFVVLDDQNKKQYFEILKQILMQL